MEKSPNQIYSDYRKEIIDKQSAIDQILFLFENSEIYRERLECVGILNKIGTNEERVFRFLENLLLTDANEKVRTLAAASLKKMFIEKAYLPIKWAYLHEESLFCLVNLISIIAEIATEVHENNARLFLLKQIKKIDLYQFRASLGMNINNDKILKFSNYQLSLIIQQYLIINHFSEHSSDYTYKLENGLVSILDLSRINKNAFGWNILKTFFDFIEVFNSLKKLDLKNNTITELPPSIGSFKNLIYLNLSYNHLEFLPESLELLQNLQYLILSHNKLAEIPISIGKLTQLSILDLRHNNLSTIPIEINNLSRLKNLDLHGNRLDNLFKFNLNIKSLKRLDIGLNKFKTLPDWITNLHSLKILILDSNDIDPNFKLIHRHNSLHVLTLSRNNIKILPADINLMKSLKILNLSNNQLIDLPQSIQSLTNLRKLDLSWNNFSILPECLTKLSSLEELNLKGNRLQQIPSSIENLLSLKIFDLSINIYLRKIPNSLKKLQKKGLKIYT